MPRASAAKPKASQYAVDLSLSPGQTAAIVAGLAEDNPGVPEAHLIAHAANSLLAQLADGGMMMDAPVVQRIEDSIGAKISDPAQLIDLIDKGAGMSAGRNVYTWTPDPSYNGCLEEIAATRGETVQAVVQDGMDYVVQQQWLFQFANGPRPMTIAESDMNMLAQVLGMDVNKITGTDIANYVRSTALFTEAAA